MSAMPSKQVIEQEIRNADCFVALLSSHYSPSRFQHYELEQAFAENNRRLSGNSSNPFLLPVYLSPIVVPIDGFDALHRISWQGDGREALMALRSRIKQNALRRADGSVLCQSHIAAFRGIARDAYFLKVANVSASPFSITHVWVEVLDEEWYFEYPVCRPLPGPVQPQGREWETFFYCNRLPGYPDKSYFESFRIRLSNGVVYKSYKNDNVASYGKIAGGPLAPQEEPKLVKLRL